MSVELNHMKKLIAATLFCAAAAGAFAEDLKVRPSVWGTQNWPGGYNLYRGGVKTGELKASVWGQEAWYGGYDLESVR